MNSRLSTAFFGLAFLLTHAAPGQNTNETGSSSGLKPLTPLKPLAPMKPLGLTPPPTVGAATSAASGSAASPGKSAAKDAPLKITTFMNSQVPEAFIDSKGQRIVMKYFRIQFKITEPSVSSLDTAVVYLFNQKKELVGSLTDVNPQAKLAGTNIKENILNYPNMLTQLTGLEKNRNYNLIFMYTMNEIQFKYAIAVVGTKDKVVADAIPGSAKIDDFKFDGKDKLVQ